MGKHLQHGRAEASWAGIHNAFESKDTRFLKVARFLTFLLFGIAIGLLVAMLFLLGAALHLNHEPMISDVYTYLVWIGSLVLAGLVSLAIFRP
ncbi:hypothetical protein [Roseovarius aestuarii]|uniref:Uncharacterized protein n=1 Tax=Roseovarius aestuarii TaxID=475083 RepID=A0A1X7BU49_9RHOB|nr:hypothetical protein [Roseovarius aestuarii]SMC13138.1 hypothetical protein ROA7745_02973 [Roseovarius aestuarii]